MQVFTSLILLLLDRFYRNKLLLGLILFLSLIRFHDAMSMTPDCPIVTGKITVADGATADPSATGWSIDASGVPNALYFATKSKRFHAENIGGIGIWKSKVFSVTGYSDFQVAVKISSEGDLNSAEYVKIYYKINGGSETLLAERTGNFGTIDFKSEPLVGNNVQLIVKLYNYDNGGSQTSKYYIEEYRVFKEDGPCSGSIQVSASATNSVLTCSAPSTTLTATSTASGVTYSWTGPGTITNPSSATATVSAAGTYTVTATSSAGSGSASVTVTENKAAPDVSATGGTLACGTSVILNASSTVSGVTYSWTGPGGFTSTSRTPTVSVAGNYTVTVTNPANGCTASKTVAVNAGTSATSAFWTEDFAGLANGVTSDAGATIWSSTTTASSSSTFSVQSNRFMAAFNAGNTAEGVWTSASIDISAKSNVIVTVDLESGTASGNDAFEDSDYIKVFYKLNGGAETSFFSDISGLNATTTGTATAIATSPALNGSTLQIVIRLKNSDPTERYYFDNVKFTGSNSSVAIATSVTGVVTCTGTAQIFATPPSGTTVSAYSWTGPNGFTSPAQNPVVSAGGQYLLTATISGGCAVQVPVTVTENKTPPDLTVTGGSLACATSFTLNASSTVSNATYRWTGPGSFGSTLKNPSVTAAGTYTVTVTDPANGCASSQSVQVTSTSGAGAFWTEDFAGLANGVTSDAGATDWTSSTTAATSGTFSVQSNRFMTSFVAGNTAEGVWTSAELDISGKSNVVVTVDLESGTASGNDAFEDSDYIKVFYKLNGGAETSFFSDVSGLNATTTGTATAVAISPPLNGNTLQIIIRLKNTDPTERYYFDNIKFTGTDQGGVNASAGVTGSLTCANTSVTLNGSSTTPGVTYTWTGPNGFTATEQNPVASAAGTYTLQVTTSTGCYAVATVNVAANTTSPNATASVSGSLSCSVLSVTLSGGSSTSGVTYSWTGPSGFTATTQNPAVSVPGIYTLKVTDPANGCSSTKTVQVSTTAGTLTTVWLEDFSGLANGTTSDSGTTGWTRQTTGGTYAVSGNEFLATNMGTTAGTGGVWTSSAISIAGTTNVSFTVDVRSAITGSAVMNPSGDVGDYLKIYYKLDGGAEVLVASNYAGINNHSTTPTTLSSGSFSGSTLQIIIKARATGSDEFYYFDNVKVTSQVLTNIGVTASVSGPITCTTSSVTLSGNSAASGVTYSWTGPNNFAFTGQNASVSVPGIYTLTGTNSTGCSGVATVNVVEDKVAPVATSGVSGSLTCSVTSVTLNGNSTTSGVAYKWTGPGGFSSVSQNPAVSTPGVYTLIVTNQVNGCTSAPQSVSVVTTGTTSTVWLEDFTGLANGTTSDNGATGWTRQTTGGTFAVSGNEFVNTDMTTATGTVGVWTSSSISIAGLTNISFTVDIRSAITGNAVMNPSGDVADYLKIYYKLDGGAEVLVAENYAAINNHNTTPTRISSGSFSGSSLQIVIKARATGSDEFYYFDNIKVTGTGQSSVDATAGVSGPITCTNTSVTLSGSSTASGVTYSWTGPDNFTSQAQNPAVTTPGQYTLTVNSAGCKGTATVNVVEDKSQPGATITKSGSITCNAPVVTLTASPAVSGVAVTYSWVATAGGGTIINPTTANPTVATAGTYTVTIRNTANGCFSTASVNVQADNAIPAGVTASASGDITCTSQVVTLTATASDSNVTYSWTGGAGTGTITNPATAAPTVTTPGTYTVTVKNTATGCSTTASVTVQQNNTAPANVTVAADGDITCLRPVVTLTATSTTGNATYSWAGGTGTGTITDPATATPKVSTPGTYAVTVTNPTTGCTTTKAVTVAQDKTLPVVTAGSSGTFTCVTTSVTLTSATTTNNIAYQWSGPGGFTSTERNPVVSVHGSYSVRVTNPVNGCTSLAANVTTQENKMAPGASASAGNLTCTMQSVTLNGNSGTEGVSYTWSGPAGYSSTEKNPVTTIAGEYNVVVKNPVNGCTSSATVAVNQDGAIPAGVTATASGVKTCSQGTVTLLGSSTTANVGYSWTGPFGFTSTQQNPTVLNVGVYQLRVTNLSNGCSAATSVTVREEIVSPEEVVVSVSGKLTCTNGTVILTAMSTSPSVNYAWSGPGGFTSSLAAVNVSEPGEYTVIVEVPGNECAAELLTVIVEQDRTVPAGVTASGGVMTCSATSVILAASSTTSDVSYRWTSPNGFFSTEQNPEVNVAGVYTLTVTHNASGCTQTATATVSQGDASIPGGVTIAGPDVITCAASTIRLTASAGAAGVTYQWTGPVAIANPAAAGIDISVPGTYTVTATVSGSGCTATASKTVTANNTVPAVVATSDKITCSASTARLMAATTTHGVSYSWTGPGAITDATLATARTSTTGTYTVTVTNSSNGCTSTATTTVETNLTVPNAGTITSSAGFILTCYTSATTLSCTSTTSGATFKWTNSSGTVLSQTASLVVTTPDTYLVTVTNPANGCTLSRSRAVTQSLVSPTVSIAAGGEVTCKTPSVVLTATSSGSPVTFSWSGSGTVTPISSGTTTGTASVSAGGTYTVTLMTAAGCTATATTTVNENKTLPADVTASASGILSCSNMSVVLTASSTTASASYRWTGPEGFVSTEQETETALPGDYTLTVTNAASGCTVVRTVTVGGKACTD